MKDEAQPENPRDESVREHMRKIAMLVDEEIPTGWGFIVICFPIGDRLGRLNYVSNGKREEVLKLLKEFLYRSKDAKDWGKHPK